MKLRLLILSALSLAVGAVEIPVNTCVKSYDSLERPPAQSVSVDFEGPLNSQWRDMENAVVATVFSPRKPIALQIVIR